MRGEWWWNGAPIPTMLLPEGTGRISWRLGADNLTNLMATLNPLR